VLQLGSRQLPDCLLLAGWHGRWASRLPAVVQRVLLLPVLLLLLTLLTARWAKLQEQ
jgi:hypothetical protein